MGKSRKVTVGYKYLIGHHMVWCYGPVDAIKKFRAQDREFYDGNITSSSTVSINKPELFGGEDREGGIKGNLDIMMGESTQPRNSYLVSILGALIPAYRGVVSTVANKMYQKAYNPYFDGWSALMVRTQKLTNEDTQWYSAKANINDNMNPAHIVREVITNEDWGMGYPTSSIDDANFTAAADTFYAEDFGLSFKWSQSAEIQEFINEVQEHADFVLYQDAFTGKFKMQLIRDDYTIGTLKVFNEDNIVDLKEFKKAVWGETVNELTVSYTDVDEDSNSFGKSQPVTVQNLGNIQMQGSVIRRTKKYLGITDKTLALKVAGRDLKVLSSALSILSFTANRDAWDLHVGSVFVFAWAKYNIAQQVFRVTKVDRGNLTDNKVVIEAIEDKFSLTDTVYIGDQSNLWTIPNNAPAAVVEYDIYTAGYWDVNQLMSPADIAAKDPDSAHLAFNTTFATTDTYNCEIRVDGVANNLVNEETKTAVSYDAIYCTLDGNYDQIETVLSYLNERNMDEVEITDTSYLKIKGVDGSAEIMKITGLDTVNNEITVERGCLDTPPVTLTTGSKIFFPTIDAVYEDADRFEGETVYVKMLPLTGLGRLSEGSVGSFDTSLALTERYDRPYAPGNLRIDGSYYPTEITQQPIPVNVVITWNHRDRTQILGPLIGHASTSDVGDGTESDSGDNINYIVTVYNNDGASPVQLEQTNVGTAKTHTYVHNTAGVDELIVEVESYLDYGGAGEIGSFAPASVVLSAFDAAAFRAYLISQGKTGYELEVLVSNPISYWRFNETSGDLLDQISGHDGLNSGVTTQANSLITTDTANKSYTYASSSYSRIYSVSDFDNIKCVELWIKPSSITSGADTIIVGRFSTSNTNGWSIRCYDTGQIRFIAKGSTSAITAISEDATTVMSTGSIYHIVVNFSRVSGDVLELYVNGTKEIDTTVAQSWNQGAHQIRVGESVVTSYKSLVGEADEMAVYSRYLTSTEVNLHYTAATV